MPPQELSDSDLISRCVDLGEAASWELFVRRYSKLIWSCIHQVFRTSSFRYSVDDAEDAYSSIFLSLLQDDCRKLRQFQGRNSCKLSTWLSVVAVRATIDHLRRQNRHGHRMVSEDEPGFRSATDPRPDIQEVLLERERRGELALALQALPEPDRQLLHLIQVNDLAPADAARTLGISIAAFYTRKHRLMERLKKLATL